MIAHCELMGDRMAILDPPPDLNAQQVHEWRVNTAGYDSKYAALYYPWIKVFDPADGQSKLLPPSGHMAGVWARNDATRGVHKAPANEVVRGIIGVGNSITRAEHDLLNPVGHQLHPPVPRTRHPGVGRADAVERPVMALRQRAPALQLRRVLAAQRHAMGGVRAQRQGPVGAADPHDPLVPVPGVARRRRCSARPSTRRSTSSATTRPTPARPSRSASSICEIGLAVVKPAEFVVFRLAQLPTGTSAINE